MCGNSFNSHASSREIYQKLFMLLWHKRISGTFNSRRSGVVVLGQQVNLSTKFLFVSWFQL